MVDLLTHIHLIVLLETANDDATTSTANQQPMSSRSGDSTSAPTITDLLRAPTKLVLLAVVLL